MFCRNCGEEIADAAVMCPRCGIQVASGAASGGSRVVIPNHLVGSILVTIFCCMPFGIPAIVYAAMVNGKVAAGDLDGAMKASKNASMWMWISFAVGLVIGLVQAALYAIAAVASSAQ